MCSSGPVNPASWSLPSDGKGASHLHTAQCGGLSWLRWATDQRPWRGGGALFQKREEKPGRFLCLRCQREKPASSPKQFPRGRTERRFTVGGSPGPHLAPPHLLGSGAGDSLTTAPGPFSPMHPLLSLHTPASGISIAFCHCMMLSCFPTTFSAWQ